MLMKTHRLAKTLGPPTAASFVATTLQHVAAKKASKFRHRHVVQNE